MKLVNLRRYTGIIIGCMAISACQLDEENDQAPMDMYVPFSISALPMPNDGYGYDEDLTISLPGENDVFDDDLESFYRSSDTVYAALDGWGLCTEPLLIPIENLNGAERTPLDPATLANNVVLVAEDGVLVVANISATSENIQIECTTTLKENTTYYLAINDQVTTQDGINLKADSALTNLLAADDGELTDQEVDVKEQINTAMAVTGIQVENIAYAAQFTTQSSYAISDAIIANNQSASLGPLVPNKVDEPRGKYDTYTAELTLPFYLPFTKEDEKDCLVDEFDPIGSCPALYDWMRPDNDPDGHLTRGNPLPASTPLAITVDVYTPKKWAEKGRLPLPVVQFIHGVTANRGTASLMAQDYTDMGYMVVAIDMPYHGERIMHDREGNPIGAEINKGDFINISSPLTLRGNLNQAVSDNLSLRNALIAAPWANEDDVHLIGHSLGGIVSVMVSEMSQPSAALRTNNLSYKTVNFAVPGQGLVNLVLTSDMLGPETEESVKKSPDIQRGIAETVIPDLCHSNSTNEECIVALRAFRAESPHNTGVVSQLEDDIYALILPSFKQGVQTSVDSADPATFTRRQVANLQPTLLIEAVGTCGETCEVGEYMPDYVVPNNSPINVLTGTDPLITALALDDIRDDTFSGSGSDNTIRGVIRATTGGHGTYLFPYEGPMDESGAPGTSDLGKVRTATETQQIAVRSMVFSDGREVEIDDHTNIEIEEVE
ncbi:hypothetical protein [Moritella dasanensis]|uniref:hypothetical protein n=1 Tax=Moritella dasanensis TaxID=428031 RepID=UPI0004745425|nr:hypothetical protein [Moritella dasanensis]